MQETTEGLALELVQFGIDGQFDALQDFTAHGLRVHTSCIAYCAHDSAPSVR